MKITVKDKRMFRTTCMICEPQYEQESAKRLEKVLQAVYEYALKQQYPNAEIAISVSVEVAGGVHTTKVSVEPNDALPNVEKIINDSCQQVKNQSSNWLVSEDSVRVIL